ncbi:mannosyltransferase [Chitinophaga dinghuensis]|uniref:Mannosyltransferase n=1 Tax=Chitinophaga dinghuensis TaxID=1539050 RepID=A0A327WEH7_9BACT|nr:glycosyltransferase family 1 protein [Chitinophaga dinghuensis]RAJ85816.1 mannosyltransferase [Chitinophaga dinghuensis]
MNLYLDNIIYFLQRSGGVSVYWTELIARIVKENTTFFEQRKNSDNICRPQLDLSNIIYEDALPLPVVRYLPLTKKIEGSGIFHSSYYRISNQASISNIVTVHDFTYEHYIKGLARIVHSTQKRYAVSKAAGIICISENTRKDLLNIIPSAAKTAIKVIPNGVSDDYFRLDKQQVAMPEKFQPFLDKKIILYVGHRTVYKNFPVAVETVARLGKDYTLAIVGAPLNPEEEQLLNSQIPGQYLTFGRLCNEELNWAYNLAYCFLYPSSYEGFGIPLLEAMRAGCPVVSTALSSIPEVTGTAALLSADIHPDAFASRIKMLQSDTMRKELMDAGLDRSRQYSWQRCYEEVLDFYDNFK